MDSLISDAINVILILLHSLPLTIYYFIKKRGVNNSYVRFISYAVCIAVIFVVVLLWFLQNFSGSLLMITLTMLAFYVIIYTSRRKSKVN